ncbi:ribonuclease H-like domain-containing protein [Tanacetum coccineum]
MFNVIDISSMNLTVGHPNGTLAKITTIGNLRLYANIVLFDVLVVPEYCVSFLILGIGNESGGLYMFDEDENAKSNPNDDERYPSFGDGNVMASSYIDSCLRVNEEATFATQSDETNNIYREAQVKCLALATKFNKSVKPKSYVEAAQDKHWVKAMNNQMEALFRNNTWISTDLPINKKNIGCKWLFKIKYKSSGEIERYKARLRVLRYLKMSLGARIQLIMGIKSKKQALISKSLAEAEHRCMASTTCKVIWLTHLLKDLHVEGLLPVPLYFDTTSAI